MCKSIGIILFSLLVLSESSFAQQARVKRAAQVVYPEQSQVDFDGMAIQGEVKNPGELYFQRKAEEPRDSLLKRRTNFHQEMLRDVQRSK